MPESYIWGVQIIGEDCSQHTTQSTCETAGCYWYNESCHSETQQYCAIEGEQKCFGNDLYECQDGQWVLIEQNSPTCLLGCSQHTTQSTCETAGCYWYPYPNPFGDSQCWDKPIYIQYLPVIAIGVGALIVVGVLLSKRKKVAYYYPPPPPRGK